MCTSATDNYGKIALVYLVISIFCAVFGAVYEHFSFGVYSPFMVFAFCFPLISGALPALILRLCPIKRPPWKIAPWLYRSGIATVTVGSIIRGVLDIYGTTNELTRWYWYAGAAMVAIAAILNIIKGFIQRS